MDGFGSDGSRRCHCCPIKIIKLISLIDGGVLSDRHTVVIFSTTAGPGVWFYFYLLSHYHSSTNFNIICSCCYNNLFASARTNSSAAAPDRPLLVIRQLPVPKTQRFPLFFLFGYGNCWRFLLYFVSLWTSVESWDLFSFTTYFPAIWNHHEPSMSHTAKPHPAGPVTLNKWDPPPPPPPPAELQTVKKRICEAFKCHFSFQTPKTVDALCLSNCSLLSKQAALPLDVFRTQ